MIKAIILFLIVTSSFNAWSKGKEKGEEEILVKVNWHRKNTYITFKKGKSNSIHFKNSDGVQRSRKLSAEDSKYLLSQFKRIPASKSPASCHTMVINITKKPSDGKQRSICYTKQPKTAKKYIDFVNLIQFASR